MAEAIEAIEPVKLAESRFKLNVAGYERNSWVATVPDSVTEADILKSEFWTHVANKMRPCDEVIVVPDSIKYRLLLFVTNVGKNFAKVESLARNDFRTADAVELEGYTVKWRGPHAKWCVMRKSDGTIMKDRMESDDIAASYMRDLTRMAA